MKEQLLSLITMLHAGKMLDEVIAASLSEEGVNKDKLLEIVKSNVEIKNIITAAFKIGVEAVKEKAANDGKTNWLDSAATLLDMTDEMIAEAIGDFVENLIK